MDVVQQSLGCWLECLVVGVADDEIGVVMMVVVEGVQLLARHQLDRDQCDDQCRVRKIFLYLHQIDHLYRYLVL